VKKNISNFPGIGKTWEKIFQTFPESGKRGEKYFKLSRNRENAGKNISEFPGIGKA
jgi:hypothetical protein